MTSKQQPLDLAQFSAEDFNALLAECKRQREETTRLRLIVERLTHAANAYPQLVEEVRGLRDYCRAAVRRVRGKADKAHYGARADLADIILRSLGEDA